MNQSALRYTLAMLLVLGLLYVGIWLFSNNHSLENEPTSTIVYSQDVHVDLPDTIFFAGEPVSLLDIDVRERFEKELFINQYWRSNTYLMLKRSGRYFPMIEKILAQEGIPDDFKYIVPIESQFENQVSPRGAAGFWQFMEVTGKEFGLMINAQIDERLDAEKATLAACKYLKRSHQMLNNWVNTAASYNVGLAGIKSVMANQYVDSYLDVMINSETSRYFFRILAVKYIFENPQKFGFQLKEHHYYKEEPYELLTVRESINDLPLFARNNGFTYKSLRRLNPAIKGFQLTLNEKELPEYTLRIPKNAVVHSKSTSIGITDTLYAGADVLNHLINEKNAEAIKPQAKEVEVEMRNMHTVQKGENLASISKKYQVSIGALASANGINPDMDAVLPGQKLLIPKP
jgi:LysM repeat protein